jgi:PAS domain S-box-containing protein
MLVAGCWLLVAGSPDEDHLKQSRIDFWKQTFQASGIRHHASSIQHHASRITHHASSIQHPCTPELPMSSKPSYEELEQKLRLLEKTLESQKAIQEELFLFKAIVESSNEAIAISDPEGQLLYINPAHEKLFGRSLEEARKLNYRHYYPPESLEILNRDIAPVLEQGKSWEGVLDVFDAKGRRFPLWERADSLRNPQGKMRYGFGLMHDIAERRQAEAAMKKASDELEKRIEIRTAELVEANTKLKQEIEERKKITDAFLDSEQKLRESERRYREIANKIPGLLYQYVQHRDGSFSIPLISERIQEYSGHTSEEIIKNPSLIYNQWVHPDDLEMIQAAIEESARTLKNYRAEHRIVKPDREIRWLRTEAVPQMLPSRDIFWNGIAIDITEAREAREEAQKAKTLLTETQQMAKVGGWELDLETNNQVWTEETYRIHEVDDGYQPDLEGGLSFFPGESRKTIEEAIQKAIDTGQPYDLELDFITAKGNPLFVRCKGKTHRKNQKIFKLSGTIQDITDRKISENALKESEARYRRLAENAPEIIYRYRFVPSPGFEFVN